MFSVRGPRRAAGAAIGALLALSCRAKDRGQETATATTTTLTSTAASDSASTPTPTPTPTTTSTPTTTPTATSTPDLAVFMTAAAMSGKSIGHTSVVFKLTLEGGLQCAYKPRSHRGGVRYRGEIAAYRMAIALGLANVPPVTPRAFNLSDLRAALGGSSTSAGELLDHEAVAGDDGRVAGALIPWIPKLEILPLERDPWRARWTAWLGKAGSVPADQRALAAQIGTLIVFDYVTGNWDRWSGENVGIDHASGTILFIDNDGAFYERPPPAQLASQLALVRSVARFSRSFVAKLRAFDAAAARAAFGEETPGSPLLSDAVLAGVEQRRRTALTLIDAKIAEAGDTAVLSLD